MKNIKVYTNSTFNDKIEIVDYLQPVTYHIVLGVNFFADFLSSWTDFLGGKSQSYQTRLAEINKEVIEGIQRKVYQIGGNAAIDLKIDNDEISAQGKSMIMVTAIATAVIIKEVTKSAPVVQPKKGIIAVPNQDYLRYKEKQEFREQIIGSKNIGPLNRLIPNLKSEHYDLITDLFNTINYGDFNPKDFLQGSYDVIKNMLTAMDVENRSEALYNNLSVINDERNEIDYRAVKCQFYIYMIETTDSVEYKHLNEFLPVASEKLKPFLIDHYVKNLDKKAIFYPSDIEYLQKGISIMEGIGANKEDYFESFQGTIERLERLFNEE